jgi:hypothetical protein
VIGTFPVAAVNPEKCPKRTLLVEGSCSKEALDALEQRAVNALGERLAA